MKLVTKLNIDIKDKAALLDKIAALEKLYLAHHGLASIEPIPNDFKVAKQQLVTECQRQIQLAYKLGVRQGHNEGVL